MNEWTVAVSLPPWTRFFIFSYIFLPLQLLFQLPRLFHHYYYFMDLFSMHSLSAFNLVLCDSGLQRGRGVCVGVWAETSHWHSMFLREEKWWSGVFAKSWCVGERSRGSVHMMCEIIETKKDREVDLWLVVRRCCSVDSISVCVCVCLNISVRECQAYILYV